MRAYIVFGRFNPPTKGHSVLLDALESSAASNDADAFLFVTQSEDKPKDFKKAAKAPDEAASILRNPLKWSQKVDFITKIYDGEFDHVTISDDPSIKTLAQAFDKLGEMNYDELVIVCGSDRVEKFEQFANSYQNDPNTPTFEMLDVISAGERDPDSDDVSGLSATKMRQFALDDDVDAFAQGVDTNDYDVVEELFNAVRSAMVDGMAKYAPAPAAEIAEGWVEADKLDNIREDFTALDYRRVIDSLTQDGYQLSREQLQEVLDVMKEEFVDKTRTAAQIAHIIHARPIDVLSYL